MKNIFSFLAIAAFGSLINAQVNVNNGTQSTINNSNVSIDLSGSYSTEAGAGANVGKGVIIPSVNLVNFEFDTSLADGTTFPTWFDGMIVYNNTSGTTLTAGNRSSTATAVTPGYYFFFNPNGATNGAVQPGVWKPIGGSSNAKFNVTTAETATNTLVADKQIYAKKGRFVASGTSTIPTSYPDGPITIPSSATAGIYRVTIFKPGTTSVLANEVYSYDIATGNLITGSPIISVVYPSGTYDYVVEYTK